MIHRHLELTAVTPIDERPLAAIHDLLDRGDLDDWRPLLRRIEERPYGRLALAVARLVDVYPMYGTSPLIRAWIERCRNRQPPFGSVASEESHALSLASLRRSSGKTQKEMGRAMGISQSDYSKLERRKDTRVSTLRSAAKALGGSLRLSIELGGESVEIEVGDR